MHAERTHGDRASDPGSWRSELVDLSGVSLAELDQLPPNALSRSLRRILIESSRQPRAYNQNFHSSI